MWRVVRELLWRLIDPSLGFGFVVRRAVYTQRVVRVLQAMPAFAASKTNGEFEMRLARMVSAGREVFLPRYRALSNPEPDH